MASEGEIFMVGYALAEKKVKGFLQPSLVEHTRSKGVNFVPINMMKPLGDQGPFDAIIHKHGGESWTVIMNKVLPCVISRHFGDTINYVFHPQP